MAHRLSKSRFQTGLQCPKALWLACNARELADPIAEGQQHIFDTGTAVGILAQRRFDGGVLVEQDHTQSAEALARTREVLSNPPRAIFEAAFEHHGVFVRPDVLVNVGGGMWDLYEVKSGTRVKPENITDVAVQTWVIEGAGLQIRRTYLMHLNNTYIYQGGELDLDQLFTADDVTEGARAFTAQVPGLVAEMLQMVDGPVPELRIGSHCAKPYTCSFYGHCHEFLPSRPVTSLPRISDHMLDRLLVAGIHSIENIPLDFPGLTRPQLDVCEVVRADGHRYVGDLGRSLSGLTDPIYFLDFETVMSAIPLWAGTRPWQQVPFQWSLHKRGSDGALEHFEYLHESIDDPRRAFVSTLIDALGDTGSIVVYSPFENTQLNRLAEALPEHASAIGRIQQRLFDLLAPVRRHLRHPDCLGSSSIKAVLPALVPELSYEGLGIGDGSTAARQFLSHVTGRLSKDESAQVFTDLREYCGLDTMAMVRLLEVLQAESRI